MLRVRSRSSASLKSLLAGFALVATLGTSFAWADAVNGGSDPPEGPATVPPSMTGASSAVDDSGVWALLGQALTRIALL